MEYIIHDYTEYTDIYENIVHQYIYIYDIYIYTYIHTCIYISNIRILKTGGSAWPGLSWASADRETAWSDPGWGMGMKRWKTWKTLKNWSENMKNYTISCFRFSFSCFSCFPCFHIHLSDRIWLSWARAGWEVYFFMFSFQFFMFFIFFMFSPPSLRQDLAELSQSGASSSYTCSA